MNMRVECYGASRPQSGRTTNEDAFVIGHGAIPRMCFFNLEALRPS